MSSYYAKIDVTKINKDWLFHAPSGAKYLDIAIRENRDGPGKFGDTHIVFQNPSKIARDSDPNIKGVLIGNAKPAVRNNPSPENQKNPQSPKQAIDEDVPF